MKVRKGQRGTRWYILGHVGDASNHNLGSEPCFQDNADDDSYFFPSRSNISGWVVKDFRGAEESPGLKSNAGGSNDYAKNESDI